VICSVSNESWYRHEGVMSHKSYVTYESCHIWVMSRMSQGNHTRVLSHMTRVTNKSWYAFASVMPHMSHVTHESCHKWVMSRKVMAAIRMSRVMDELLQAIVFGVSFDLILQSQYNWSLFNGTWQKRHRELAIVTRNAIGCNYSYGVATISRLLRSLLQNIVSFVGLFCNRDL